MLKSVPMQQYIAVGNNRFYLGTIFQNAETEDWLVAAQQLRKFLIDHEFKASLEVGRPLWETLDRAISGKFTAVVAAKHLQSFLLSKGLHFLARAMDSEADGRQMIQLKIGDVSTRLRNLHNELSLQTPQKHLLDETIRCLECEAYRSAAVMGWNLAYDYIRQWILADSGRLAAFNDELVKIANRKGATTPKFQKVNVYEDFFESNPSPGEREVLDVCEDAKLIQGKPYDALCHYLRQRNEYAHPNNAEPTIYKVNAYIEELINTIRSKPFK